jgi:Ser/Thr protein kinase RdoA (MazF antagonist)
MMPARVLLFILDRALWCSDAGYSSLKSPYVARQLKLDPAYGLGRNIALQGQSEGRFFGFQAEYLPGPPQNNVLMSDLRLLETITDSLAANYGIEGSLTRLPGENLNFLVTEASGVKHVLKIVDEHMPPAVVEMEYAVMEHAIAAGFKPHLPRIIENIYGNIETQIKLRTNSSNRLRLLEFIDGIEMSDLTDISNNLLFDLGKTVAEFDVAMKNFEHPAAQRSHRWNLAEAQQHENKILFISDPSKKDLLNWSFALWRRAKGDLTSVPWQFIHGDAHDENILVRGERVSGLIDFGDCCRNPTVCDPAICITYLMMRGDDPLRVAATILEGYQSVRRLSMDELELLYPLVCTRLAVSVCVANKRKTIDPDNPNWFGGEKATWRLLQWLRATGAEAFGSALGLS